MDTTGFSQVGRYGTLSLLKRRSSTPSANPPSTPNDLITSFGIDEATLTFGSTSTCGVRLYYSDVDPLHCKLVFEDGKAFLSVLGQGGVLVDGCWVYPHSSSSGSNPSTQDPEHQQTIIPLSNNSEFEIHQKRFRFTYPPKEVRKILLASPAPAQKRALRLSMIHSAQVFSPRPSKDPRENLRILQSPLKQSIFPPRTPGGAKTPMRTRAVSPLKYSSKADSDSDSDSDDGAKSEEDAEEPEDDIVLVATNHPRVVEEEQDLVILEDVPLNGAPAMTSGPSSAVQSPAPLVAPQPPRTPRRKSIGGNALHRAVLIRSAQRAVWRAREEEEELEEEMEVLGAVVNTLGTTAEEEEEEEDQEEDQYEDQDVEMRSVSSEEEESEEEDPIQKEVNKSLWRKSLERIIPWGFGAAVDNEDQPQHTGEQTTDTAVTPEVHEPQEEAAMEEDDVKEAAPLPLRPAQTPIRRVLGSFMTPQVQNPGTQRNGPQHKSIFPATERRDVFMAPPGLPEPSGTGPGRFSLGGGEARRVIVQQPWRVKDLVVPPPAAAVPAVAPPTTPGSDAIAAAPRATPAVTAEERRAIQERRRSAVREVREDTFWKDGAPGMSPGKSAARMSLGGLGLGHPPSPPMKQPDATGTSATSAPRRSVFASPTKGRALGYAIAEEAGSSPSGADTRPAADAAQEDDEELDTRSLLDRMRETVDDMKRRRSIVASTPRVPPTPVGAPTSVALTSPTRQHPAPYGLGSVKKLDFSRVASPVVRETPAHPTGASTDSAASGVADSLTESEMEVDVQEEEPFSLLRPAAHEGTPLASVRKPPSRSTRAAAVQQAEEAEEHADNAVRPVALPDVVIEEASEIAIEITEEEVEEKPKTVKTKGKGRSQPLRAAKPVVTDEASGGEGEEEPEVDVPQVKPKSTRSRAAAKSPAPPSTVEAEPTPALAPPMTRRQRSKTPQPPPQEEEMNDVAPPRSTRRSRRGTAEPEEPTPAPVKRGKKAAAAESEQEDDEPAAKTKTPAKRGRKPRVAPVEEEQEEDEADAAPEPEPVPTPAPAKRSRSKKAAAPIPEIQDDDELDSYVVGPSSLAKQSSIPVKAAPKSRKKAAPVKEEPMEVEQVESALPLAATRGRAAAPAKTPAPSKTAVPATTATKIAKPRTRLRTPGSAPAAAARSSGSSSNATSAEKENAQETAASTGNDEAEDAPVKVRVSRRTVGAAPAAPAKTGIPRSAPKTTTRAAVKSKVKVEEEQDNGEEASRGRTTRATRTRTKTG